MDKCFDLGPLTSVMGTKRSIYLFTPERPRDLSARAPEPAPQESLSYYAPSDLPWKETEQDNQSKVTLYTPTLLCLVPAQGTEVTYVTETFLVAVHCDITVWDPIHSRVIIQWQPITHTSFIEAFALIEVHTAAGGEHINRATFVIGGKDRDPAPVGNHPGVFHVQQTCRHR